MPKTQKKCTDFVQPRTGTAGGGNCLIGPYRPLGMVRIGPDAPFPYAGNNGYFPSQPIAGFSHTHVAGTGGASRYGNVMLTPYTGDPEIRTIPPFVVPPVQREIDRMPSEEESRVGYYSVTLHPWKVRCELTATRQAGMHRYTFSGTEKNHILLDAAACLCAGNDLPGHSATAAAWDGNSASTGGWMEILSNREIIGRSDIRGGWGHDKSYSIFYYYRSDQPFDNILMAGEGGFVPAGEGREIAGKGLRCSLEYPGQKTVTVCVGISFVSVANARQAVEEEIADKDFDTVRSECVQEWEELLSQYKIDGGTPQQQEQFYTMLYRLYCMPTDLGIDHENPYWKSGVRQFTDYYCLWDSIRNANSFFHLFDKGLSRDILNSLLDIASHTGWLPDAYIANHHAYMQSACACGILFPEAMAKGVQGVDYRKALQYLCKNTEAKSPDPLVKGRHIDDYRTLGYLSTNLEKSCVSKHLEYTYHDWCIAQLADALGESGIAAQYTEFSNRVWNLWNADKKAFCPRNPDGSWQENFDPWKKEPEAWNSSTCYEGPSAVWSFNVFQDFYGLIERMGGKQEFVRILQRVFDEKYFQIKETRMHMPHLFTYAGRPDLAAEKVLESLRCFNTTENGLPDNEDMGCQSAYFLWQSIGLYPIYGQQHYMLTPPLFDRFEKELEDGRKLTITVQREGEGRYIRDCLLGGKRIHRAWVTHKELTECGNLHFALADTPGDFGRSELPPSYAQRRGQACSDRMED